MLRSDVLKSCRIVANLFAALTFSLLMLASAARAETVTVAVATNFLNPVKSIAADFEKETGHTVRIISGSTGKLYAQIKSSAPFDVFLSADSERPRRLVAEGDAVRDSWATYATGLLVLWSADPERLDNKDGMRVLGKGDFRKLALANPKLAPYGLAAAQALERAGLWEDLQGKLIKAENVGQVFAMTATGNAEFGFIARSQIALAKRDDTIPAGSFWPVPDLNHDPIDQDVVLLERARGNAAAAAFVAYLMSEKTQAQLEGWGYKRGKKRDGNG